MYKILFDIMEEIIKKIEVSEPIVKQSLEWLSANKINGLHQHQVNEMIRFLLVKVVELETKIKEYEK